MKFEKWVPISGVPKIVYLEALYDDYEGFRLLLKGPDSQDRMLRLTFESPLLYRNIDEGNFLKTLNLKKNSSWSFFIVNQSNFLAWFNSENYYIRESEKITHYAIYTPNDCIDILSACSPVVEWLNE